MTYEKYEPQFIKRIREIASSDDPAHDFLHFQRVVATAKAIGREEAANMDVVVPAAWLHDFVIVPKNDPRRKQASRLSAAAAIEFLREIGYPSELHEAIGHAIEAHSFSANIECRTLEAKVVQDADRLDGLGAIGIARVFATAGLLRRPFYAENDPFCLVRAPNDGEFTIDHFYAKLFKTAETLKTRTGRQTGEKRVEIMKRYLTDLGGEL